MESLDESDRKIQETECKDELGERNSLQKLKMRGPNSPTNRPASPPTPGHKFSKVAPVPDGFNISPKPRFELEKTNTSDLAAKISQVAPAPENIVERDEILKQRWRKMQALVEFLKVRNQKKKAKAKKTKTKSNSQDKKQKKRWKRNMRVGPFKMHHVEHSPKSRSHRMEKPGKTAQLAKIETIEDTPNIKGRWREVGRRIVESNAYEILVVVLTFIALFLEDIETLLMTSTFHHTDAFDEAILRTFSILRIAAFVFFLLDLIAGSIFKLNYNCKLIWWLDLISAISMLPLENLNDVAGANANDGFSLNYLVALKAFKVARAARLLKMLRVVRLAKIVRLLRVINLGKKRVADHTFVIGDHEEKNDGHELNADHMKEQLTTMIVVKVLLMILLLMFGLPIIALFLGEACYNLEKTNTQVYNAMDQMHIMFSNTRFYDNQTQCEMDSFCNSAIDKFRYIMKPYLSIYVSNITLAGNPWCNMSKSDCSLSTDPISRGAKSFHTDMCSVMVDDQRINCLGCENTLDCCPECDVCAPCFGADPPATAADMIGPHMYAFTVDITLIARWEAQNSIFQIILLVLVMLALIFIFRRDAGKLSSQLALPVRDLARNMERLSRMDFSPGEEETKSNLYEITRIQKLFSTMRGILQSFAKFVPREVVRYLVTKGEDARLNMHCRELTIFFSDIASFTTICESLRAKELYLLLSSYFEEMSKIIVDSNGTLIEYIGDAILAVWNAPMKFEDHACLGICSTLLMQERLRTLRQQWAGTVYRSYKKNEIPDFQVRCGLHTAYGYVGNMGSPSRMKYGIAGGALATAGMLEELNKTYGTPILVSESTYRQPTVHAKVLCRMVDYAWIEEDDAKSEVENGQEEKVEKFVPLVIEGAANSTRPRGHSFSHKVEAVYEPLGIRVDSDEDNVRVSIAQFHQEAFKCYRQRNFLAAADNFDQAIRLCKHNPGLGISAKAPRVLKKRCLRLAQKPPPTDWKLLPVREKHA